jgi:hypothetical protein
MTPEKANEMNEERALENGNKLAFPIDSLIPYHNGLTKREYIATQLMAAAMAGHCSPEEALGRAIKGVDLLLIELNKK